MTWPHTSFLGGLLSDTCCRQRLSGSDTLPPVLSLKGNPPRQCSTQQPLWGPASANSLPWCWGGQSGPRTGGNPWTAPAGVPQEQVHGVLPLGAARESFLAWVNHSSHQALLHLPLLPGRGGGRPAWRTWWPPSSSREPAGLWTSTCGVSAPGSSSSAQCVPPSLGEELCAAPHVESLPVLSYPVQSRTPCSAPPCTGAAGSPLPGDYPCLMASPFTCNLQLDE